MYLNFLNIRGKKLTCSTAVLPNHLSGATIEIPQIFAHNTPFCISFQAEMEGAFFSILRGSTIDH
jgi:hypothetical protein